MKYENPKDQWTYLQTESDASRIKTADLATLLGTRRHHAETPPRFPQAVMGWMDSHLHQFEMGGVLYGTSDRDSRLKRVSENKTTVDQLLRRPKDRLTYEFDFGDSWVHDVILEAVLPQGGDGRYPIVEAGRRACPPEDVGGIYGYAHFLEVIANPKHPEHREMLEWVGESFDPEFFDVHEANLAIHGGWVPQEPEA